MASLLVLKSWHTYGHCYPNRGLTWTHEAPKNSHILPRIFFFEACFQDEDHLYANCLFYILSHWLKCLLFQIRTRGIPVPVSIRTGV